MSLDPVVPRFRSTIDTTPFLSRTISLESILLEPDISLRGASARESRSRDRVQGLLVGVERHGYRQLNPPVDLRLEAGDRLWIVGDSSKISSLNS